MGGEVSDKVYFIRVTKMHVVLISACEKRAIKRTRMVLDSYALRHGDYTWMTPITLEGLQELRGLLRRNATRQTAVACFLNDGRKRMRLLWVVGNSQRFDRFGVSPIGSRLRKGSPRFPEWARVCAILAAAAGEMHDLGKFGQVFQDKLRNPKPSADPVRHEWISFLLVKQLVKSSPPINSAWAAAWETLPTKTKRFSNITPFDGPLKGTFEVLLFLIATHHRLLASDGGAWAGTKNHVRADTGSDHAPTPTASPTPATWERIEKRLGKVYKLPNNPDPLYWRGITTIARLALILADHAVSAEIAIAKDASAYANTQRQTGHLNQSLDWHLEQVGREAGRMVSRLLELAPPWLSGDTLEELDRPASDRFTWQNVAADALRRSVETHALPHLILNMAGTGSGKTRMNMRALAALAADRKLRVATALNLRTLTLQTADAYTQQLRIGADELACVIGDRVTRTLYEWQKQLSTNQEQVIDDDENVAQTEIDTATDIDDRFFTYTSAPEWLQRFLKDKPNIAAVIGAPVVVSTIDFLIAAGEPQRQAHHALAMLRIMTSDLILDEIDGYDPKPLVAVLRLVMMAAFWGRNVVASSATLSRPVAEALWRAYAKGSAMRAKVMGGEARFVTALIDDLIEPCIEIFATRKAFMSAYEGQIGRMLPRLIGRRFRVPYLVEVKPTPPDSEIKDWHQAIKKSVARLHKGHAWVDPISGKRISFGLVRVANIKGAIPLARELANTPGARVVCYHSQLLTLQRHYIETTLDRLLTRKNGDEHILHDPVVRAAINRCTGSTIAFIVVATPVEEIGRDHDFDWAVIEPSSVQSIVQTAGRVNRHRLISISGERPNVAILQFNRRAIITKGNNKRVFQHPGFEVGENSYPSHDLKELLDWEHIEQIDARLRFDKCHDFASLDDQHIGEAMANHLNAALSEERTEPRRVTQWMIDATYQAAPLREHHGEAIWLAGIAEGEERFWRMEYLSDGRSEKLNRTLDPIIRHDNDWLILDIRELHAMAREMGISPDDALRVSMPDQQRDESQRPKFDRSFGWWNG
ncbi:CRISPR-associated endonuclease/helicase Cas3 [Gammaproteobacteria bacterium]